jgi:hypothetical protein
MSRPPGVGLGDAVAMSLQALPRRGRSCRRGRDDHPSRGDHGRLNQSSLLREAAIPFRGGSATCAITLSAARARCSGHGGILVEQNRLHRSSVPSPAIPLRPQSPPATAAGIRIQIFSITDPRGPVKQETSLAGPAYSIYDHQSDTYRCFKLRPGLSWRCRPRMRRSRTHRIPVSLGRWRPGAGAQWIRYSSGKRKIQMMSTTCQYSPPRSTGV